jgi:geranylgeranyl reductase family protein
MARLRDAIVVGAGPAGSATAARLHRLGVRDVLVLERAQFPRDKPCGGGLTGRCHAALAAVGLRLAVPKVAAQRVRIRFGGYERTVDLPRPVDVVRRVEFDASLVEQVRPLGIAIETGARVSRLAVAPEAVTLHLASGDELRARVVIGADGAGSIVRKHLRGDAKATPLRLLMQELPKATRREDLLFDFTPMLAGLRGYAWTFPVAGGRVNVGVLHSPPAPSTSPQLLGALQAALAREGIELPARGVRGWPAWGSDPRAPVAGFRLLTVGDAAGIDALTGEGIAVALQQAQIAAAAAARALAASDFRFAGYRAALARTPVGRDLALDRWLAARVYGADAGWQRWLPLLLFDRDFVALYAARIAGTGSLAAAWCALARAYLRDRFDSGARQLRFAQACAGADREVGKRGFAP